MKKPSSKGTLTDVLPAVVISDSTLVTRELAILESARTGVPYVTRLDPPPADPRVAHPPRASATETS